MSEGISQQLIHLARIYFCIDLPVNSIELKKAYKKRCRELHPDIGGNERDFREMQKAYELITESGVVHEVFSDEKEFREVKKTTDGTPLSELGLGLGPTENGKDCPECQHRGYFTVKGDGTVKCSRCDGFGFDPYEIEVACRPCHGTGKFQQARSKRVVDCRACNGTGKYSRKQFSYRKTPCRDCDGLGRVWRPSGKLFYVRCSKCNGKGEVPVWNPIILKAALK